MNWKFWLGLSLLIAFCIGIRIENDQPKNIARRAQIWDKTAQQLSDEAVCNEDQWFSNPEICRKLSDEKKPDYEKRLPSYQR